MGAEAQITQKQTEITSEISAITAEKWDIAPRFAKASN